jgi:alkanesulfonate monooxygenase SsuD/methylene tetrahydromethanopterin reductase-like flavin-dependent oxidoreductase (luciferase family)
MICAGVCAAEHTDEALFLRSSQVISFANLITGKPSKLAPPDRNIKNLIPPVVLAQVEQTFSCSAVGDAETIEKQIKGILTRYQPDELMITGAVYDHDLRKRSFGIASKVLSALKTI